MAHIAVTGSGLRTTFAAAPRVHFRNFADDRAEIGLSFAASPLAEDHRFDVTTITFAHVIEFHFIDFETGLHFDHEQDVRFALIELTDSTEVQRLIANGRFASEPTGRRLGAVGEANVRHYRITFDDHGTYDVVCAGLVVERSRSDRLNEFP